MIKKLLQKLKYLENEKSFLDEIKKHLFIIFKRLSIKQITQIFLEIFQEGENPTLSSENLLTGFMNN